MTNDYKLPWKIVIIAHIKDLAEYQANLDLKLAPKLTADLYNNSDLIIIEFL